MTSQKGASTKRTDVSLTYVIPLHILHHTTEPGTSFLDFLYALGA